MKKQHFALHLFTVALIFLVFVPTIFTKGMFLDGVIYATISKNLSHGLGGFWIPYYSSTYHPIFYEHPSLAFILQSFFYDLFGDAFWVEKFYSFICLVLSIIGIHLLWKNIYIEDEKRKLSWIAIILFCSIPIVLWSYKNNMLENTLSVFTFFSTILIYYAIKRNKLIFLIPSSIMIVSAFFTKGVVGLFPLIIPIIYFTLWKSKSYFKIFTFSLANILIPTIFIFFFFLFVPESFENIKANFEQQLLPSLANEREVTTNHRFYILLRMLIEMVIPIAILCIILIIHKLNPKSEKFKLNKNAIFLLLVGLSASIPLILTLKQRGFYLIPALPFFAMAISIVIVENFSLWNRLKLNNLPRIFNLFTVLILCLTVLRTILLFGSYSRDEERLSDIYKMNNFIEAGTVISGSEAVCNDWQNFAYLNRFASLDLDCKETHKWSIYLASESMTDPKEKTIYLKYYTIKEK